MKNLQARFVGAAGVSILAASVFPSSSTNAATISPVMVELSAKTPVASIRVSNDDTDAIRIQAQVLSWHQAGGRDIYQESSDLIVAPAIIRIPAGTTQVFRVALRSKPATEEQSYRLILEDVTSDSERVVSDHPTIRFRVSHNLPVFFTPVASSAATPSWSRCSAPAGKLCVRLDNRGSRRIRLSNVRLVAGSTEQPLNLMDTVLAGGWKQWTFNDRIGTVNVQKLRYRTEAGETSAGLADMAVR